MKQGEPNYSRCGGREKFEPTTVAISPEVLTNSWLSVPFDIPNKREAIVNISPMKDWRFLPHNPLFSSFDLVGSSLASYVSLSLEAKDSMVSCLSRCSVGVLIIDRIVSGDRALFTSVSL
jgi:hypothetical protein